MIRLPTDDLCDGVEEFGRHGNDALALVLGGGDHQERDDLPVGPLILADAQQDERLARVEETRIQLRNGFDPLMRCVRVIVLEGPETVAQAARGLQEAAAQANSALWRVAQEKPQAREYFDAMQEQFRDRLDDFIAAAHAAVSTL